MRRLRVAVAAVVLAACLVQPTQAAWVSMPECEAESWWEAIFLDLFFGCNTIDEMME